MLSSHMYRFRESQLLILGTAQEGKMRTGEWQVAWANLAAKQGSGAEAHWGQMNQNSQSERSDRILCNSSAQNGRSFLQIPLLSTQKKITYAEEFVGGLISRHITVKTKRCHSTKFVIRLISQNMSSQSLVKNPEVFIFISTQRC